MSSALIERSKINKSKIQQKKREKKIKCFGTEQEQSQTACLSLELSYRALPSASVMSLNPKSHFSLIFHFIYKCFHFVVVLHFNVKFFLEVFVIVIIFMPFIYFLASNYGSFNLWSCWFLGFVLILTMLEY